jgi:hypothetical protein
VSIDVNGLIAFGAAVLTFIASFLTLLPLLRNRTKTTTAPLDPLIKIIKIERLPIDQQEWTFWFANAIFQLCLAGGLFYFAIYLLNLAVRSSFRDLGTSLPNFIIGFIIVLMMFYLAIPIIIHPPFQFRFRYAKDAKFFIYQSVSCLFSHQTTYVRG